MGIELMCSTSSHGQWKPPSWHLPSLSPVVRWMEKTLRTSVRAEPQDERSMDLWVNMSITPYIQILLEEYMNLIGLIHWYLGIIAAVITYHNLRGVSRKSTAIVNIMRIVCVIFMWPGSQGEWTGMHRCEQGLLHCITVLVNRDGRHRWVSMCTVWPQHSKWLSE